MNTSTSPPFESTEQARRRHRTLIYLLACAYREALGNGDLHISYSVGNGIFARPFDHRPLLPRQVEQIKEEIAGRVRARVPLKPLELRRREVLARLREVKDIRTLRWLQDIRGPLPPVYPCGEGLMAFEGPLCDHTGDVGAWDLQPYPPGLLLRYPQPQETRLLPYRERPTLFRAFYEAERWGRVYDASFVSDVNRRITRGGIEDLILVSEALVGRKIATIADSILQRHPGPRVILVSGPSASGKTSFAHRLRIELRLLGLRPNAMSLDDFYLPRSRVPRTKSGEYDYEVLEAIDIGYFNEVLLRLIAGETVRPPRMDFATHHRRHGSPISIRDNGVLIVEGIHGLNPRLTPHVTRASTFRIYVSALTHLNWDELNRVSTTDLRLLRRIVRDRRARSTTATETLSRWPVVRHGETRHIFPFQEEADVMLNSALPFELNALKEPAEAALAEVQDPGLQGEFQRLRRLLAAVRPLPEEVLARTLPPFSLFREFIGGSVFTP